MLPLRLRAGPLVVGRKSRHALHRTPPAHLAHAAVTLDRAAVAGILPQGGTILGTHNRCDPFHYFGAGGADVSDQAMAYARELGLDALVAIGGDGTMAIAHQLSALGLPVVGVPKTIDNDLCHNDRSFGFDSAVAAARPRPSTGCWPRASAGRRPSCCARAGSA